MHKKATKLSTALSLYTSYYTFVCSCAKTEDISVDIKRISKRMYSYNMLIRFIFTYYLFSLSTTLVPTATSLLINYVDTAWPCELSLTTHLFSVAGQYAVTDTGLQQRSASATPATVDNRLTAVLTPAIYNCPT